MKWIQINLHFIWHLNVCITFGTCWACCWCTVVILVVLLSLALLKYKRRIAVADDVLVGVLGTISESELYECVVLPIGCRFVDIWSVPLRGPIDPLKLAELRNGIMTDFISKCALSFWAVAVVVVHDLIIEWSFGILFNDISARFIDTAVILSVTVRSFFAVPTSRCDAVADGWARSFDFRGEKCVKIGELFFDDELLDPASVAFICRRIKMRHEINERNQFENREFRSYKRAVQMYETLFGIQFTPTQKPNLIRLSQSLIIR